MKKRETPIKKFVLRMEPELYEKLEQKAKDEDRSVNATINQAIKKYIKEQK